MQTDSTGSDIREAALEWLRGLNHKQFAEVFYEAVASRNTSDVPVWRGHFLLADAEIVEEDQWRVNFIAIPAADERPAWRDDAPICQSGTCDGCDAKLRSWSKRAECPVCGRVVDCS